MKFGDIINISERRLREYVRESMSEKICPRKYVRENMSEDTSELYVSKEYLRSISEVFTSLGNIILARRYCFSDIFAQRFEGSYFARR